MAQTAHIKIGDSNDQCGNIIGSFNNTVYKSDEDAQIMRWLSPLEPNNRHQSVRNERLDGVGDWLLKTREFREWRGSEGGADVAVLCCNGNPGVGKTYLSSLVIDSLCDQAEKEDIVVAGFYCDFLAQQDQTITNMMGAILKQLAGRGDIPNYLREAFHKGKREFGGRGMRLPDMMGMLKITVASLPQVFICIDALDECLPKHLPGLLKSLRDMVQESPRMRIFLTGRPYVKEDVQRYFAKAVVIPISPNTNDIRSYLEMRLDGDTDPEAMNGDLRADIIRAIMEKISDIFLLVSLNVDAILGEVTIHQRRKKLEEMTKGNGLSDAYAATLSRLKAQKGNKAALGLKVLMWVLYSERPLRPEELCHAFGVEVGSTDLNVENVPAVRTLVASCLGLVTVEGCSPIVRLVHYTLQEHLSSDPTLFHSPHSKIAEVCLTYLNFGSVRKLSPILRLAPATTPLLEYASRYWGEHTRKGMTENVKTLALRLLDRFDKHISAQLMLLHFNGDRGSGPYFGWYEGPMGFTGLHGVAFLGIVEIFAAVLGATEWDINATDGEGSTALIWAAGRGHEAVVKVLLDREDVNPDQGDTIYGRTPLSWAAGRGHERVVEMLLERGDVNPDQPDTFYGQTPLSWAAWQGHEGVARMLLERGDVDPNRPDTTYGQTPLSWAAETGHEGVVKMLLERGDVNPDQADTHYGRTPLLWAAMYGHEQMVKLLLDREDVNPDRADTRHGRTPLSWAAKGGHKGVVKILLEKGIVNPDQPDTHYDQTPLSWADRPGHEEMAKLLLDLWGVNPDQADTKSSQTPPGWATENWYEGVVKILLEQRDVHTTTPESEDQIPLLRALSRAHAQVLRILLERDGVNSGPANRVG